MRITGILSTVVAALLLTTSCNDSYPGLNYEPNPDDLPKNDEEINIDKTPIKLYTNNPAYFSIVSDTRGTRGTGAFEAVEADDISKAKYYGSTFNVFAFRAYNFNDPKGGQGVLTEAPSMRRYSYATNGNSDFADSEHTSCLLDGADYKLGMGFRFEEDTYIGTTGSLVKDWNDELYYSDRYQDVGYNFFGYYVDDLDVNSYQRESDAISYDINIDGYQDILAGYAKPLTDDDFKEDGVYANASNIQEEERQKILSIPGNYSTYAAHRNINPVLDMKHQLTLLKFQAYAGSSSAKKVTITGISVQSLTHGKLTVASRKLEDCGLVFYPEDGVSNIQKPLAVGEVGNITTDASGRKIVGPYTPHLRNGGYNVVWKDEWIDNPNPEATDKYVPTNEEKMAEAVKVGAGLLVAPQESYVVTLTYTFPDGANGALNEHKTTYKITPVKMAGEETASFKKGYMYNIKIGVYGLEKIEMGGSVQGWEEVELPPIDPDENPNNPAITHNS